MTVLMNSAESFTTMMRLSNLRKENTLYIAFQIGMRAEDRGCFISDQQKFDQYLDSLGHQSLASANRHDFEWRQLRRSVLEKRPHGNPISSC